MRRIPNIVMNEVDIQKYIDSNPSPSITYNVIRRLVKYDDLANFKFLDITYSKKLKNKIKWLS